MKNFFLYIVALVAIVACTEADMGKHFASELNDAWGNADSIKQIAAHYTTAHDSVASTNQAKAMNEAFIDGCAGNDSIQMLARAIALSPSEMGKEVGDSLMGFLTATEPNIERAVAWLGMIDHSLSLLDRRQDIAACYDAIDQAVESLPVEDQMRLYVASCSPETLANELRKDRANNPVDADQRATMVQALLSGERLATFNRHYYAK